MVSCAVLGCNNYSDNKKSEKKLRYYCFPKSPQLAKQWISVCGRNNFNAKNARVCMEHFNFDDFNLQDNLLNIAENKKRLKTGVIPSKNLPKTNQISEREKRQAKRQKQQIVREVLSSEQQQQNENDVNTLVQQIDEEDILHSTVAVQTEVEVNCSKELEILSLRKQLQKMKRVHQKAVKRLQHHESKCSVVSKMFTKGQLKRLEQPKKKLRWAAEDISSAIALYSAGPRSYRLLCKRKFPLPAASTLRKWAAKLKLHQAS